MAASALPFDSACVGDERVCWKPHSLAKSWKALELNWRPLSKTTSTGLPNQENTSFSSLITIGALVFFLKSRTSVKNEK